MIFFSVKRRPEYSQQSGQGANIICFSVWSLWLAFAVCREIKQTQSNWRGWAAGRIKIGVHPRPGPGFGPLMRTSFPCCGHNRQNHEGDNLGGSLNNSSTLLHTPSNKAMYLTRRVRHG